MQIILVQCTEACGKQTRTYLFQGLSPFQLLLIPILTGYFDMYLVVKAWLKHGKEVQRLVSVGGPGDFFLLLLHSKFALTPGSFVDILLHFDTVSEVSPMGHKAWVPCGVVFDWCSLSPSMWCVPWCGGDRVRYPCWSWSGEQLAPVPHSHSGFAVVSHHIFPPRYDLRGLFSVAWL